MSPPTVNKQKKTSCIFISSGCTFLKRKMNLYSWDTSILTRNFNPSKCLVVQCTWFFVCTYITVTQGWVMSKENVSGKSAFTESTCIYYINTNEIPNHFDLLCSHNKGDISTCEDNMLFSHVKIWSFRAKAHLVFHWCLYNKSQYLLSLPRFLNKLTPLSITNFLCACQQQLNRDYKRKY